MRTDRFSDRPTKTEPGIYAKRCLLESEQEYMKEPHHKELSLWSDPNHDQQGVFLLLRLSGALDSVNIYVPKDSDIGQYDFST